MNQNTTLVAGHPAAGASAGLAELQRAFREVMASVCTPVSVVTTMCGGLPFGTTVSAFSSLSMDPPMILVALDRGSDLLAVIRQTSCLGLNILGSHQSALAGAFARKGGVAKFTGVPWHDDHGVPRLPGAAGFLTASVAQLIPGGDHIVVLANVHTSHSTGTAPLTYHNRVFGTHTALRENVA
jgi:flavin reductase (DIM6/NTAB) family NADH-FMN oxidoreductase RutF